MYTVHSTFLLFGLAVIMLILVACSSDSPAAEDPLVGTSWQLLFYRKSTVLEGTRTTLHFEDGQVNGSAGCNTYFGPYKLEGQSLNIDQIGVTEMYCMEPVGLMDQEMFFLETLSNAQRYELSEGRLMIFSSNGEALTFEPLE